MYWIHYTLYHALHTAPHTYQSVLSHSTWIGSLLIWNQSLVTALHCTALYITTLWHNTLHCTALYCIALHCTALHCTALFCTPLMQFSTPLCIAQFSLSLPPPGWFDIIDNTLVGAPVDLLWKQFPILADQRRICPSKPQNFPEHLSRFLSVIQDRSFKFWLVPPSIQVSVLCWWTSDQQMFRADFFWFYR